MWKLRQYPLKLMRQQTFRPSLPLPLPLPLPLSSLRRQEYHDGKKIIKGTVIKETTITRMYSSISKITTTTTTTTSRKRTITIRSIKNNHNDNNSSHHYYSTSIIQQMAATKQPQHTVSKLPPVPPNCHRIVMMRHGESEFNNANIFTGWCDVALTPRGLVEAMEAGQVFLSHNLHFRKCYVSLLTRSIVTAHRALEAAGVVYTPLQYDWRWNERHYGALQGLSKERTAIRLGRPKVMEWRRSYDARPPAMTVQHPHYYSIQNDPRYKTLVSSLQKQQQQHQQQSTTEPSTASIPLGESLKDCQNRVIEAWKDLCEELRQVELSKQKSAATTSSHDTDDSRKNEHDNDNGDEPLYSLLVAHANTLRALVMYLDEIAVDDIESLNIPTAIPFYYDVDKMTGRIVMNSFPTDFDNSSSSSAAAATPATTTTGTFRGVFVTDERKRQCFLERRRAANDPWLWALHDHQVATSCLLDSSSTNSSAIGDMDATPAGAASTLAIPATPGTKEGEIEMLSEKEKEEESFLDASSIEEEARRNTKLFSPTVSQQ